jgi:hypothetical protein
VFSYLTSRAIRLSFFKKRPAFLVSRIFQSQIKCRAGEAVFKRLLQSKNDAFSSKASFLEKPGCEILRGGENFFASLKDFRFDPGL